MFRLYSKGCEHTIRALLFFVPDDGKKNCAAKEVCEKAKIPEPSTRKIFQSLVQGGFLKAITGPGGGYALRRSPDKINVLSLIKAVDGKNTFEGCVMGLSACRQNNPCPLHQTWRKVKKILLQELKSTTLQDLIDASKPGFASQAINGNNQAKK